MKTRQNKSNMYLQWVIVPGTEVGTSSDSLFFGRMGNASKDLNFKVKVYAYKIKQKKPVEQFTSLDTYYIKNRGIVYIVRNPKAGDPRKRYIGKTVSIDSKEYRVKAIELFMIHLPYPESWTMGLLV